MRAAPWKTALVTGASSGLGRGLAAWLAGRGVTVYAAARRLPELEALRAEAGERVVPLRLDVGDADATFARVQALDEACGGLDLVVANAGVGEDTRPRRLQWASVHRMVQVNVAGATATLCGALPGMVQRRRGHLAGISSLAGLVPLPGSSTYCATKAYLSMFLESLRLDVAKHGLAVTAVHPGFVKSAMTAKNRPGSMPFLLETEDAVERLGRALWARQQEVRFPWPLASAIRTARALPRPLRDAVLRRLR